MNYLFIDSTYDLTLGILGDDLNWLSFERHVGQKASMVIQVRSLDLIKRNKQKAQDLSGVITVSGPGFYTGLRLAEGVSDVFQFFGIKQYSLYSYEIPFWCGHNQGAWFTKAYRGEYFIYRWNETSSSQELITANEIKDKLGCEQFFVHSDVSLDSLSQTLLDNPIHSSDLLRQYPARIFKKVLADQRREPFYFRPPEDEFKVNP